ncbi:hypothetical protein GTP55_26605 [Duganella sp. FT109W]|uniref:Transmembrane protein n=1 Tax=Duganella margarita TaxID=2692170 RepID=A0ABW9WRJ9_9BURK|nr:hypothetical protein [Duganella margarita]MYN42919.1 hypothetical protein [Duganella margarita]
MEKIEMPHAAYVGVLILIFICFVMAFTITGIIFWEYCSVVATAEGRLEELLNDAIGADGWGPYHTELFIRLYKIENCNSENILILKRRAKWGFNIFLAIGFSFFFVLYCAGVI